METVIADLKKKLASLRKDASNYYKWIADCRKNGHEYGVESYTESRNEVLAKIPEYTKAISILKKHNK